MIEVNNMLTYHFPQDHHTPMYEYLYECIKNDIIQQKMKANEKLPSKRLLAKHLQVSLVTVENAYNQLLIEGYISSIEKKGYFVNEIEYPDRPKEKAPVFNIAQPISYRIDLKTNSVSPTHFPFSIWSKLTRQVLSSQDTVLLSRPHPQGCLELREAIAQHLYSFSGMNISPHQIVIGAGTEYLYNLVIQLLGQDKIYALEDPGHQSISKVYHINQVKYCYISLDKSGVDMHKVKQSQAQVVHISPAHHYPTGITMPIQRRLELLAWAKKKHGYIIEDDYDSEFRMRGKPISTLFQIDQNDTVIYMNTFSKTLAPSFRISYMVLPIHLLELYQKKMDFYACSVSSFEQIILAQFIKQKYFEKHINRMRNSYKMIRDEFLEQLNNSSIASHIQISEENAGLHFLLHYQSHQSDLDIIEKAKSLQLHIACLSQFYNKPFESHTLIINYSGLQKKDIKLAVDLLTQLLKDTIK